MKGRSESKVTNERTAKAAGSGTLNVYATPWMIALMENAACAAIGEALEEGQSSVGTMMNVSHVSATPVSMKVWAEAEVTGVDRRKVSFKVSAYDEAGLIGEGVHERFVISEDKFIDKCYSKLEK